MNGLINWFLINQSLITFFLSLVGSVGAIFGWISSHKANQVKLDVNLFSHHLSGFNKVLIGYFSFVNSSKLPVSITRIKIVSPLEVECITVPVKALETTSKIGSVIANNKIDYSMEIPINLQPLQANSGYLVFASKVDNFEIGSIELIFQFHTNRGKVIQKTLSLSDSKSLEELWLS